MALAGVDGVGHRQVVDHLGLPVLLVASLAGQAVVEAGQAGALKGGHPQNVREEDCAAGRCEATKGVPCNTNDDFMACCLLLFGDSV